MPSPANLSEYSDTAPFSVSVAGHDFEFLPCGGDRLAALLSIIGEAQHSLKIFYYMFQDDNSGRQVRDALVDAAERGVEVSLIVDRFGTDAGHDFFAPITAAGGDFQTFSPRWNVRYLIRNHQKFVVADGKTALVGGFNVSDHYFAPPAENGWRDMGVVLNGEIVGDLAGWFAKLSGWTSAPKPKFRDVRAMVREWSAHRGKVQLLMGGPTRVPSNWARQVKRDLARASRLDLVMAYFSPPRSFRRLMRKLAKRGRSRLIMAGTSDNGATIGAARALYGAQLRAGAKVFEYQPSKLHMKMIVIDDVSYFGSANFDMRSIRLNLEMMFRVESPELAARLRQHIDTMEAVSLDVTYELHKQRSNLWTQLKWRTGWFLVSALDYTVSRRLNAGM